MNDEAKQQTAVPAGADTAKLVAAIILVFGGIVAFYVLKSRPEAWASWVAMFGGMLLAVVLLAFSQYGRNFAQFFLESRVELRKVFWPTRQETFTTTLVVLGFVAVASLFFWLLDLMLAYATKFFTGTGS
jgi:preprotein translocase subunit SecE